MIYYKLNRGEQKVLSILGTFAGQADTGADLDQAMAAPVNPIGPNVGIASQKLYPVEENMWYDAGHITGQGCDSFVVGRLTCCAAVLLYGEEGNLIAVGHAKGGLIDDSRLDDIKSLCKYGGVQHIIYATPSLSTDGAGADKGYKNEISRLVNVAKESRIYIIDGFGQGTSSTMGTVIGDMDGNISFQ